MIGFTFWMMRVVAFVIVWLGCIVLGWFISYWADPNHDVEWTWAAGIGVIVGGVLFGPLLGYSAAKIVSHLEGR